MGFVFIKFSSTVYLEGVLEHGLWLIHSVPLILRNWTPTAKFLQDELTSVYVWVKLHGDLTLAFTTDGLSAIATRLGTPMILNSLDGNGFMMHTVKVEYEWKPPRCVFCRPVTREQDVKMDRNHPKKQQFIPVKLKTARGVSTSTNTPVSNVFEVLGDLEDDGRSDALDIEDCGKLEGVSRILTILIFSQKKDGKTILLNLQASDDDADVENGCDDTTTLSRLLGTGSTQMLQGVEFEVEPQEDRGFKVEPLGSGDLGVIALIQKDAHESLTFRNAVALEVISKWMVVMKEDMDTRLDLCMLNNGFRQSSDDNNIYY
ncbi:zinc knuckle CX2CX4HX4C containing protein [Tanacetum coccineum]